MEWGVPRWGTSRTHFTFISVLFLYQESNPSPSLVFPPAKCENRKIASSFFLYNCRFHKSHWDPTAGWPPRDPTGKTEEVQWSFLTHRAYVPGPHGCLKPWVVPIPLCTFFPLNLIPFHSKEALYSFSWHIQIASIIFVFWGPWVSRIRVTSPVSPWQSNWVGCWVTKGQ